jgi:hypothetical protein
MIKGHLISILILSLLSTHVFAEVKRGIQGHNQGDVIALANDDEIVKWCDFNKEIVVTATNVLCVYNGKS